MLAILPYAMHAILVFLVLSHQSTPHHPLTIKCSVSTFSVITQPYEMFYLQTSVQLQLWTTLIHHLFT